MANTRKFQISARKMVETSVAQTIWQLTPQEDQGSAPFLDVGGKDRFYNMTVLWEHAGSVYRTKVNKTRFELTIPGVGPLLEAIRDWASRVEDAVSEFEPLFGELLQASVHQAHALFEKIPEADQPDALSRIRLLNAVSSVQYLCYQALLRGIQEFPNSNWVTATGTDMRVEHASRERNRRKHEKMAAQIRSMQIFFDMVSWSKLSRQLPHGQELLPPGYWPWAEKQVEEAVVEEQPEDEQLELGDAMAQDDVRVDFIRDVYYMDELGCLHRLETQGWFGGRHYVAYEYMAPSGDVLYILDCAAIGNAAYLFLRGAPLAIAAGAWLVDAASTKIDLLTRPEGERGTFVRRFIHAKGWQQRLKEWLERTYPQTTI